MASKLLTKTLQLLEGTEVPLEKIAVDTGLKYSFLARLKWTDRKSVPSVEKCEVLYEYLSGKQLEV